MTRRLAAGAALALAIGTGTVAATPATAAPAPTYGFVLVSRGAPIASGTFPSSTVVSTVSPGKYKVTFPGIAGPSRGVVHVTALNDAPHWCQADSWSLAGADVTAVVDCYTLGGAADNSGFALTYASASSTAWVPAGARFGYLFAKPSGALIETFNSTGATNIVTPLTVGQWSVGMPGLNTPGPMDGGIQVTAADPTIPAHCSVAKLSSVSAQHFTVACFGATGVPVDVPFTATYQYQAPLLAAFRPPTFFGYLLNLPPLGPAGTNYNPFLGPTANFVTPVATGITQTTFPALGKTPDSIQATPFTRLSAFCALQAPWTHPSPSTVANLACWDDAGNNIDVGLFITDNTNA